MKYVVLQKEVSAVPLVLAFAYIEGDWLCDEPASCELLSACIDSEPISCDLASMLESWAPHLTAQLETWAVGEVEAGHGTWPDRDASL